MSAERAGGQEGNQRRRDLSADARRARTQQRTNSANNAAAMDIKNKTKTRTSSSARRDSTVFFQQFVASMRATSRQNFHINTSHQSKANPPTTPSKTWRKSSPTTHSQPRLGLEEGRKEASEWSEKMQNCISNQEKSTGQSRRSKERIQCSRTAPQMTRRSGLSLS